MKKVISIVSILLMINLSCFASGNAEKSNNLENETQSKSDVVINKEGFPIVDDSISLDFYGLKWPNHKNYEDMPVLKSYEELSNVNIDWTMMQYQSVSEKKNLLFANRTGLPDAFFGQIFTNDDLVTYGEKGLILPLNDLIDEYAPHIKAVLDTNIDMKRAMVSPDGNIYSIASYEWNPHLIFHYKQWINKDWLDELGLEMPTTVEELHNVLKSMKGKDLNGNGIEDEIPLSMEPSSIIHFLAPWGVESDIIVRDGVVKSGYLEPGFREGISWLADLYSEGLIDKELFTQTYAQFCAKGGAEDPKIGFFVRMASSQIVGKNVASYDAVPALEGPDGKWISGCGSMFVTGKFTLPVDCSNPAVCMRWVDYLYTKEGQMQFSRGVEGKGWETNDDGSISILDPPSGSYPDFRAAMCPGGTAPTYKDENSNVKFQPSDEELKVICETLYEDYLPKEQYPLNIFYTSEESKIRSRIVTTIDNFTDEYVARFITGDLDINSDKDYNEFVKNLNKLGIEDLIKVNQEAYTRYLSVE